jgi:hypothetical protein
MSPRHLPPTLLKGLLRLQLASPPPAIILGAVLFVGCGKKVPAETQSSLDAVRADARLVAETAAKACGANVATGRFEVTGAGCSLKTLPGEQVVPTMPSPAKGTALEGQADVIQVRTFCYVPVPGKPGESCGMGLDELRPGVSMVAVPGRTRELADSTCRRSPGDCEETVVPSQFEPDAKSIDLRIIKPVVGGPEGATAEITVTILAK